MILKLNASGDIEWSKLVGGKDGNQEGNTLKICSDGSFIIAGSSEIPGQGKDVYVVKISNEGEIEWSKIIGGQGDDIAYSVNIDSDGSYILAGETNSFESSHDYSDSYFIKLDNLGNLEWTTILNYASPNIAYDVTPTTDGGFAAVGMHSSSGYIAKMDSYGEMEWLKSYGLTSTSSRFNKILTLPNGNIVAVGSAGEAFFLVVETFPDGVYNKGGELFDQQLYRAYGADIASDGGFIISGNRKQRNSGAGERVYFIKTDSNYSTCIPTLIRPRADPVNLMYAHPEGDINDGDASISDVMSLEEDVPSIITICSTPLAVEESVLKPKTTLYPNPTNDIFTIESEAIIYRLNIATPDGKVIYSSEVKNYTASVSMKNFAAGIYLIRIYSKVGAETRKVIVSK